MLHPCGHSTSVLASRRLSSLPDVRPMTSDAASRIVVLITGLLLAACVAPPVVDLPTALPGIPADFPRSRYEAAIVRGDSVYEIDANQSLIRVFAYRAGSLSRIGHDHVIASRAVGGFVLLTDLPDRRGVNVQADLYMSLFSLTVDDEDLRAEAGFGTEVSERARIGTRSNMLASLDAAGYPHVTLHIEASLENSKLVAAAVPLQATITLHGISLTVAVLAQVSMDTESLHAAGRFALRQSDFGIQPHSALGGALTVRDELDIAFQINAFRGPGQTSAFVH